MRVAAAVLTSAVAAGCGLLPTSAPEWVTNRSEMPSCGEETVDQGLATDPASWDCLREALEAGREAELVETLTTLEGDSVTNIVRVHSDGEIELIVDATHDRYGSGAWERYQCERLLPEGGWDGCVEAAAP